MYTNNTIPVTENPKTAIILNAGIELKYSII